MRPRRIAPLARRILTAAAAAAIALAPLAALADFEPQPPPPVPEPSGWLIFGLGALGMGWAVRRRGRR